MRVLRTYFRKLEAIADRLKGPDESPYVGADGKAAIAPYTLIWSRDDLRMLPAPAEGEHLAVDVQAVSVSDEGVAFRCSERFSATEGTWALCAIGRATSSAM